MGFKRSETSGKILTIIGEETTIKGSLSGSGPVRIDGAIEGEVTIDGDIIIGENAIIQADVHGENIQLAGKIIGNLTASKKLEIMASGIIQGDVSVTTLQVAEGAILTGSCSMNNEAVQKQGLTPEEE